MYIFIYKYREIYWICGGGGYARGGAPAARKL